jgi:hypothetical protein
MRKLTTVISRLALLTTVSAAAVAALVLPQACSAPEPAAPCQSYSCATPGTFGNSGDAPAGTVDELRSQAEVLFNELLPEFNTACGTSCHASDSNNFAPKFLIGPKPYDSIRKFSNIVRADYPNSMILTMPQHSGNPIDLFPVLAGKLTTWLRYEAAFITQSVAPATDAIPVTGGKVTWRCHDYCDRDYFRFYPDACRYQIKCTTWGTRCPSCQAAFRACANCGAARAGRR